MCQPNRAVTRKSEPRKKLRVIEYLRSYEKRWVGRYVGYRKQTGVFIFSCTLKSADAPCAEETSRNSVGVGAVHAVFLKKPFRAHVGFTGRPELMSGLPDRKLLWS
jgi:hypothetical protein